VVSGVLIPALPITLIGDLMTSLAVPSPVRSDTQRRDDSAVRSDTQRRNDSLLGSTPDARSRLTPHELAEIVQRLASDVETWRPLLHFDPERRWYTRLQIGAGWEAWLLTWLPGQGTDLHDHGGSSGAFTALQGQLRELTPSPTGANPVRMSARTLHSPQIRAFGPSHIHRVINEGDTPAASLHVYGPALNVMNRYTLDLERGPVLALTERAGQDW
jgi:predicted metal-dependent enzyme (double-stranded beta helix superfamily)